MKNDDLTVLVSAYGYFVAIVLKMIEQGSLFQTLLVKMATLVNTAHFLIQPHQNYN